MGSGAAPVKLLTAPALRPTIAAPLTRQTMNPANPNP